MAMYRIDGLIPTIRRIRHADMKTWRVVGDSINLNEDQYIHFTQMGVQLSPVDSKQSAPEMPVEEVVPPIDAPPKHPMIVEVGGETPPESGDPA